MNETIRINDKESIIIENNPKSGIWYVILAWLVGVLGIHNFYAGYFVRGFIQLILTTTSWLFGYIPLLITIAWVFLEVLFVNKDALGIPFQGNIGILTILKIIVAFWLLGNIYYLYSTGIIIIETAEVLPTGQEVSVEATE